MSYPASLDELTDGVPSDGAAPTTALDNATYPHDDHHRALAVAVEAVEAELGTDPSGASATVAARLDTLDLEAAIGATATFAYNADGTVASIVSGGTTISLTYNTDGTVATVTRGSDARTFAYNTDGTVSAIT